nr:MAG TPA: hypothetical protein [Caudoviricetes sp.]
MSQPPSKAKAEYIFIPFRWRALKSPLFLCTETQNSFLWHRTP